VLAAWIAAVTAPTLAGRRARGRGSASAERGSRPGPEEGGGAPEAGAGSRPTLSPTGFAAVAGLIVLSQAAATAWPRLAPAAVAAWFLWGVALPAPRLGSPGRRILAALAVVWAAIASAAPESGPPVAVAAGVVAATTILSALLRLGSSTDTERRVLFWILAGFGAAMAFDVTVLSGWGLLDAPRDPRPWLLAGCAALPAAQLLARLPAARARAEHALAQTVAAGGLVLLVTGVYSVALIGLARPLTASEHRLMLASAAVALAAVLAAVPLRFRLAGLTRSLTSPGRQSAEQALAGFGAGMVRALPMEELLLQLAETLNRALGPAEVWIGDGRHLRRATSVPHRPEASVPVEDGVRQVLARTPIARRGWLAVWLPEFAEPPGPVRVAPARHHGELLGLLVVRRRPGQEDFGERDEHHLTELARQVGLALNNLRLDTELQSTERELRVRNDQLQASRLRIVNAADASRRAIERDLHDGAQQHLAALTVRLGLARDLLTADPAALAGLLEDLHRQSREAGAVVRELAHGVFPPTLRDFGLGEALLSASRRMTQACRVEVDVPERCAAPVETAVYFCCLEAIQNAQKHAGDGASVTIRVSADPDALRFSVADDGVGFDGTGRAGDGFLNMQDRLGALGGALEIESSPGRGTTVRGTIPLTGAAVAAAGAEDLTDRPAARSAAGHEDAPR
jgi:signal transduction histidine kinase